MKRIDFLKRLITVGFLGKFPASVLYKKRKIYLLQCFVAGFRFYKGMELLNEMEVNDFIELRREPENQHDDFAIALYWQQEKIGFIPAEYNAIIARLLDASALPLLATITHLNREVKPWENVVVAVYFLQEERESLPTHAKYLSELANPVYKTKAKKINSVKEEEELLFNELYYSTERVIDLNLVTNQEAKAYYQKYYGHKKVYIDNKEYTLVDDDGIYHFLHNNFPIKWVMADDGESYILFEHREEEI